MIFWTLAIALTVLACAALYYAAAGRTVNAAGAAEADPVSAHHRLQLKEIESDIAAGRLGEAEGITAKAELAREVLRLRGESRTARAGLPGRAVVAASIGAVALIAVATYAAIGSPDTPAAPFAARPELPAGLTLDEAVARIEEQLVATPDDVRGWIVIAPAYMKASRFADAERAYRNVVRLSPSADAETNLAEAILLQNGGVMAGEPQALLESAAGREPTHVRSRFYLAGEATRAGDFVVAKAKWEQLIALGHEGDEWMETARNGLAAAEAGLAGTAGVGEAAIRGMVEGLDARLKAEGGAIEEWTQLVQSRLVLEQKAEAQLAYDAAVAAYPDAVVRAELDTLARSNGLEVGG